MLQIIRTVKPRTSPRRFSLLQLLAAAKSHFSAAHPPPPSDIPCAGIAQSVISKASSLFPNCNHGKVPDSASRSSLNQILRGVSDTIPDVVRRFRRLPRLEPEHVLEMLLGFQFDCGRVKREEVECLWRVFDFASKQGERFKHLPKSCEVMASLLIGSGMLTEVQLLLLEVERRGVLLERGEVYDGLVRGYVEGGKLERAGLVYEKMREQGLVPSSMCYRRLLGLFVRMRRSGLAFRVCLDMVETRISLGDGLSDGVESVGRLLCADGMINEARRLVEKGMGRGFEASSVLVNDIACGYCARNDYEDSLKLFAKMRCAPSVLAGNKMLWSLCHGFDAESANLFRLEMERLGFRPDEKSFSILIGQCCKEGDLRSAFLHLSEMVSRGLEPGVRSYNALISGVMKESMWQQARVVLDEMFDSGITPGLSTFRVLLAGYFKARRFEEAKRIVIEMGEIGLFGSFPVEDPLSKAFDILGFNPASVRFKRDNGASFLKTEFCDQLGNGLYLDADIDEYEDKVNRILEDSLVPDFNVLLRKELDDGNFRDAFSIVDEMVRWGQEPTPDNFARLVKGLCGSRSQIRLCSLLIGRMPKFINLLNEEVLNRLAESYCKIGLAETARMVFCQMTQRSMRIGSSCFTALIIALCKKGNLSSNLLECWDIAQNSNWLPQLEDCDRVVEGICYRGMLKEALELLERLLLVYPHSRPEIYHLFVEKLSITGFASVARLLVEELERHGFVVDGLATYSHLVAGLCKERKFADSFKIFNHVIARSMVLSSDVSVVSIPCLFSVEKGNVLEEIKLREADSSSFSIIRALHRRFGVRGKVEEAVGVLQDILSKGLLPNTEICEVLFEGYCKASNLGKAKELLGVLMRNSSSLPLSSYRSWVRLTCREGRFGMALGMKDLIIAEETDPDILVIYYNILVFDLLSAGNRFLTRSILNEMEAKGLPFNDATYNFLIDGFAKCKDVSSSMYYMSAMISRDLQPSSSSLRSLVSCLLEQGKSSEVLDLSREMESKGCVHGSILQNAIAEQFLVQNKVEEAVDYLDRVVYKGLIPDTINYDRLLKLFCRYGRTSKAVDLLNIMLKKRNLPNSRSYDCIIQTLCKCNRLNEALDFHFELLDRGDDGKPSMETWSSLVHKLCHEERTSEAEELLHAMVAAGEVPTREMYSCIIENYRTENNLQNASNLMRMMQRSGYEPDFESQWSLISNLRANSMTKEAHNHHTNGGFLSGLLFGSGHPVRTRSNPKIKSM